MLVVNQGTGAAAIWKRTGEPISRAMRQQGKVSAARLIDDEKRFAVLFSDPPTLYLGDVQLGDVQARESDAILPLPFEAYRGVISASGNLLATGKNNDIQLWDVQKRKVRAVLQHKNKLFSFAFSRDGRFIASGASDNIVRLFDTSTGKLLAEMAGHGKGKIFLASAVYSLSFSPNGEWLASGGHDGRVMVWDTKTYKPIMQTKIAGPPIVCSVAFSSDSKLVAGSFENANGKRGIRVWEVVLDDDLKKGRSGQR